MGYFLYLGGNMWFIWTLNLLFFSFLFPWLVEIILLQGLNPGSGQWKLTGASVVTSDGSSSQPPLCCEEQLSCTYETSNKRHISSCSLCLSSIPVKTLLAGFFKSLLADVIFLPLIFRESWKFSTSLSVQTWKWMIDCLFEHLRREGTGKREGPN